MFEGAENNQPDEAAHRVARAVLSLLQEAEEDDIVMVLISGGGSALLPCPVDGVSLKEKAQVAAGYALSYVHYLSHFLFSHTGHQAALSGWCYHQ